mgnify:CR=1 FL=1
MIDLNTLNPEQRHIETLRRHGARVRTPDGSVELNSFFYYNAIDECIRLGCNAITYDLILPDCGEDEMAICIWKNGHVDSGSMRSICDCLAAR